MRSQDRPRSHGTATLVAILWTAALAAGQSLQIGPPSGTGVFGEDLAHDPTHDTALALTSDADPTLGGGTRAQLLLPGNGITQLGYVFWVNSEGSYRSQVVNVASRECFVVAYQWSCSNCDNMLGIAVVDAATGQLRNSVFSLGTASSEFAISGSTGADDDIVVAWIDVVGNLMAAKLEIDSNQFVSVTSTTTLLASGFGDVTTVDIASHGGTAGRRLIAYSWTAAGTNQADVRGIILDADLNVIDAGPIVQTAADERRAKVDGDGERWITTFRRGSALWTIPVIWNTNFATAWTGPERELTSSAGPGPDRVTWTGDTHLVSYDALSSRALVSLDAWSHEPCQGETTAPNAPFTTAFKSPNERVLLASGSRWEATIRDGQTIELGGGCAAGGRARAHCAISGNASFQLGVWDARGDSPTFLAISNNRADTACGGCTLVPDLATGLIISGGNTDFLGNAMIDAPMPNDPGLVGGTVYLQWLTVGTGGCLAALELSDALEVTIQ